MPKEAIGSERKNRGFFRKIIKMSAKFRGFRFPGGESVLPFSGIPRLQFPAPGSPGSAGWISFDHKYPDTDQNHKCYHDNGQ